MIDPLYILTLFTITYIAFAVVVVMAVCAILFLAGHSRLIKRYRQEREHDERER